MRMNLRATSGWRLREAPFRFQRTYATSLATSADATNRENLPQFVQTLLAPFDIKNCEVRIELFVSEPTNLMWYLKGLGIATDEGQLNRASLFAENKAEAHTLLECVLGQWADFAFFADTQNFAIYADHDEYTTIFAANQGVLNSIRSAMREQGFKEIEGWTWTGPHSPGNIEEGTNV